MENCYRYYTASRRVSRHVFYSSARSLNPMAVAILGLFQSVVENSVI